MIARFFTKRNILIFLILVAITLLLVLIANWAIERAAKEKTFSSLNQIPRVKTGLLLGTGKYLGSGIENPFYTNRIKAALDLYKAGKIERFIISGDNSRKEYDEPGMMRRDLINGGVDSTRIYLDYAGFRTLDSVVRAKEIFGQDSVTFISQQFHNERAIFLADHEGMYAIGYNAGEVSRNIGIKTYIREYFARTKVFIDLMIGKDPHFLGEKVDVTKAPVVANSNI